MFNVFINMASELALREYIIRVVAGAYRSQSLFAAPSS
jgi:hypothetical protein